MAHLFVGNAYTSADRSRVIQKDQLDDHVNKPDHHCQPDEKPRDSGVNRP